MPRVVLREVLRAVFADAGAFGLALARLAVVRLALARLAVGRAAVLLAAACSWPPWS